MTREQELAKAIEQASLPSRDYRIFSALLRQRAEWKTATIPDKFQPRGLAELAKLARMSKANLCRGLDHLESHGWIVRDRAEKRGRGHRTTYQLTAGMSCDCIKQQNEPVTDAERMRRYRARQRATAPGRKVSQNRVTRGTESVSEPRDKVSQDDVTKCLSERNEIPDQGHFSAKEGRDEGSSKGGRGKEPRNEATPEPEPDDPEQAWLESFTFPPSMASWPAGSWGEAANRNQSADAWRIAA